jgi:hypothetical protein
MRITDANIPTIKSHADAIGDYAVVLMYTETNHKMFDDRKARLVERLEELMKLLKESEE